MSIYKRGGVYWYKFMWQGELVRESSSRATTRLRVRWNQRIELLSPRAR